MIEIFALSLFAYCNFFSSPGNISIPGGAEPAVEQAKEDLSKRRGIDKNKIAVTAIDSVDWPDTSLGCPEPGKIYAQVITSGYKVLLSYEKEIYEYHSDKGKHVIFCMSEGRGC